MAQAGTAIIVHAGYVNTNSKANLPVGGNQEFPAYESPGFAFASPNEGKIKNAKLLLTRNVQGGVPTYKVHIKVGGVSVLSVNVPSDGSTGVIPIPGNAPVAAGQLIEVLADLTGAGTTGVFKGTVSYEM